MKLAQIYYIFVAFPDEEKNLILRKGYESWLRLIVFIYSGIKRLCYEMVHTIEKLPPDGTVLHCELQRYDSDMHFRIHEETFCPSNKFIDESKLSLLTYITMIHIMFGEIYMELLNEVMAMRNKIFPIENVLTCTKEFEQRSFIVRLMSDELCKDELCIKLLDDFKTCDLFSVESYIYIYS